MKKLSFLCIAIAAINLVNSQSQVLKSGTLIPNKKGGNVLMPAAAKAATPMQATPSTIILVGGRMDPNKPGNVLMPKDATNSGLNQTYVSNPNYVDLQKSVKTVTTDAKKGSSSKKEYNQDNSSNTANDGLMSLTATSNSTYSDNNRNNLGSLLDNTTNANTTTSVTTPNKQSTQPTSLLEPLTSVAPNNKAINTAPIATTQKMVETVDPALMNNTKSINVAPTQNIQTKPDNSKMPRLASIDGATATQPSKLKMPELAPIDGVADATKTGGNKTAMPELAAIEGETTPAANKAIMPELAAIEDENAAPKETQQNVVDQQPKVKTNLRGLVMPRGTTLSAKNGRSYIFKPAIPVEEPIIKKESTDDVITNKPSAGGGMGMPALAPIAEETRNNNINPELAPIESPVKYVASVGNTAFEPVQTYTQQQQQYQQTQPQQRVQYSTPKAATATKQQLLQSAKNHQHDPNNPCCKVQQYNPPTAAKKAVAKKPVYRKKRYYYQPQPQQEIVYVYEDPHQAQPIQRERIVYVPTQPQYGQPKQQIYQPQPQPQQQVQQVQQVVQQPQQKVIYRDYTNQYSKQAFQSNNCNCPGSNNQQQVDAANKDGKKYYNPNNYAKGLNAGPTSGDYTASNDNSDASLNYAFYLNPRGKYSVGLYNNYCSIIVSQNGELKEYKINGDPKADPNSYRPKLNYFGKPESVAGVPIEYNYNRTVHRIGNIKFEYDFEGFFKTVGNSNVFYTSRSSLAKVDDVNVQYDGSGNVTSVDPNNGLIQFNP